jgi:predicted O-methyltransferase YrrM
VHQDAQPFERRFAQILEDAARSAERAILDPSNPFVKTLPIVGFGTSFGISTLHLAAGGLIDLVLLDGAKALYPDILGLLASRLRPRAFIVADNADYSPDYLAHMRSPANGYLSTPFGEDVELSMRIN